MENEEFLNKLEEWVDLNLKRKPNLADEIKDKEIEALKAEKENQGVINK